MGLVIPLIKVRDFSECEGPCDVDGPIFVRDSCFRHRCLCRIVKACHVRLIEPGGMGPTLAGTLISFVAFVRSTLSIGL